MIFANESLMVANSRSSHNLSKLSGADAMVSKLVLPPVSETLVRKHITDGAVLYRVLGVRELIDIDTGQLLASLDMMLKLGTMCWQSVLVIKPDSKPIDIQFTSEIASKIDEWVSAGGTNFGMLGYPVSKVLEIRNTKIESGTTPATRILYPSQPQNTIEKVKDYRRTIATFPYMNERRANAVRESMLRLGMGDNLLDALYFLTDESRIDEPDATMKQVRIACREYLCLPEGLNLSVDLPKSTQG